MIDREAARERGDTELPAPAWGVLRDDGCYFAFGRGVRVGPYQRHSDAAADAERRNAGECRGDERE